MVTRLRSTSIYLLLDVRKRGQWWWNKWNGLPGYTFSLKCLNAINNQVMSLCCTISQQRAQQEMAKGLECWDYDHLLLCMWYSKHQLLLRILILGHRQDKMQFVWLSDLFLLQASTSNGIPSALGTCRSCCMGIADNQSSFQWSFWRICDGIVCCCTSWGNYGFLH